MITEVLLQIVQKHFSPHIKDIEILFLFTLLDSSILNQDSIVQFSGETFKKY
jgi:hypothetical protein